MSRTEVYDVTTKTDFDGITTTIVIRRGGYSGKTLPKAGDIPADVRAALAKWIEEADRG